MPAGRRLAHIHDAGVSIKRPQRYVDARPYRRLNATRVPALSPQSHLLVRAGLGGGGLRRTLIPATASWRRFWIEVSSPTACRLNSRRSLSVTVTLSITVAPSDSALLADCLGEATFDGPLDLGKRTAARFRFTGTGGDAVATGSGPDSRVRRPLGPALHVFRSVGGTEDAQCDHPKSSQDAVHTPRTEDEPSMTG